MKFPKRMTTVTPFSKILAVILFIALPLFSFFWGMDYQLTVEAQKISEQQKNLLSLESSSQPKTITFIAKESTTNWKTYRHTNNEFSFSYPQHWFFEDNYASGVTTVRNSSISFFKTGTKADHGYGDHVGNEVFSFEISSDSRTLKTLKDKYYPKATYVTINDKEALQLPFDAFIIKLSPSRMLTMGYIGSLGEKEKYMDTILSTLKFESD